MIRAFLRWLRNEWRLIRLDTWVDEPKSTLGTMADPRVAKMVVRQRAYGKRLRRQGRSLLSGKEYIPAMTQPAPAAKPPKGDKVVPIRSAQRSSQDRR